MDSGVEPRLPFDWHDGGSEDFEWAYADRMFVAVWRIGRGWFAWMTNRGTWARAVFFTEADARAWCQALLREDRV